MRFEATDVHRMAKGRDGPVLLYDGLCNLCSGFVRFVMARDRNGRISYAPLQAPAIRQFLLEHGLDATRLDTMACVEGDRVYTKSTAVIKSLQALPGGWRMVGLLLAIPAFIRDWVYDVVGRNRYRWFGQRGACFLPPPGLAADAEFCLNKRPPDRGRPEMP